VWQPQNKNEVEDPRVATRPSSVVQASRTLHRGLLGVRGVGLAEAGSCNPNPDLSSNTPHHKLLYVYTY
jgi:hypothetical protein